VRMQLFIILTLIFTGPFAQGFPAYYDISEHEKAQAEARQRNLPLAWLGGYPEVLSMSTTRSGSLGDVQQMAMATLQNNAVIIFFDGANMAPVPAIVHAQIHIHDDGNLLGGADWNRPKVVFTNPEVTQVLGRVSETDMYAEREAALNSALQIIRNNPMALALPGAPSASPAANTVTPGPDKSEAVSGLSMAGNGIDFLNQYGFYVALVGVGLVAILFCLAWSRRGS
jgi:hypothetical protein